MRALCTLRSRRQQIWRKAASAFGLAATPSAYKRIEVADARRLLVRILSRDLAYDSLVIPVGDAERLAQAFLKEVCDAGCLLYTNGTFHEPVESLSDRVTRGASWNPMTDATFDTGVLAIGPRGAACVWVEDED